MRLRLPSPSCEEIPPPSPHPQRKRERIPVQRKYFFIETSQSPIPFPMDWLPRHWCPKNRLPRTERKNSPGKKWRRASPRCPMSQAPQESILFCCLCSDCSFFFFF